MIEGNDKEQSLVLAPLIPWFISRSILVLLSQSSALITSDIRSSTESSQIYRSSINWFLALYVS